MPRRDGTGPMGQGTMTGRGLGLCTGGNVSVVGAGFGRGFDRGMGLGMGLGYGCRRGAGRFYVGGTTGLTDKELLTEQKEMFQKRLDIINKQLQNLSDVN